MKNKFWSRTSSMGVSLLLVWTFFALASPEFLSPRNISNLVTELSITAILALGMLLVLLPGHIDLSVGSGVGLTGGIASVLVFQHGWPAAWAMLFSLGGAIVIWLAMGCLITRLRIPSFIITLAGLLIFKGVFWLIIKGATVPVAVGGTANLLSLLTTFYLPRTLGYVLVAVGLAALLGVGWRRRRRRRRLSLPNPDGEIAFLRVFIAAQAALVVVVLLNHYRGTPLPAIFLLAAAVFVHVLTQHTPFGRRLYAIGGNEQAAVVSGIRVGRTVVIAFAILGSFVAITGFLQTAYSGASTPSVGDLMELDAIASCVIGGASLNGGRGTVMGVLFGALIMSSLLNGMTLMAVSPEIKLIARGAVLAIAVALDVRLGGRR